MKKKILEYLICRFWGIRTQRPIDSCDVKEMTEYQYCKKFWSLSKKNEY